jgi:hypothetical protein
VATGELFEPYRLVDGDGAVVVPVAGFFAELAASGRPDVGVDDRRVQTPPLHRPVSRRQHLQKADRVVTTGRDGLLGQAALLTHPRTPVHHHRPRRRE